MSESDRFFSGESGLQDTLRNLNAKFDELGIPYVVVGGMALTAYGYARMTEDIDVLVTKPDLKKIHSKLVGLGYKREFAGSKNIRDTSTKVKIEFLLTGDYPGSGKPQPVSFPDPADTEPLVQDGVKFVGLHRLIELKLASGMTGGPDRAKDFVDVQQLIKTIRLPRSVDEKLHEYVRGKYDELWDELDAVKKTYVYLWRNKFLTIDAKSIDDMIESLSGAADELRKMKADGVTLGPDGGTGDDYAHLTTTDPDVAKKYDMHDESEFFGDEDEDVEADESAEGDADK
ncbi:MAG TPA: nucleotidyl transferase AbiEii/AbiGii toxin family protein [Polyangiales bacterium]